MGEAANLKNKGIDNKKKGCVEGRNKEEGEACVDKYSVVMGRTASVPSNSGDRILRPKTTK